MCEAPWFDPSKSVSTKARKKGTVNQWRLQATGSAEEVQSYLAANYPPTECDAIVCRLHSLERKRVLTMCADCSTHVGDDHVLPAPVGEIRMCD